MRIHFTYIANIIKITMVCGSIDTPV